MTRRRALAQEEETDDDDEEEEEEKEEDEEEEDASIRCRLSVAMLDSRTAVNETQHKQATMHTHTMSQITHSNTRDLEEQKH